ncbi:MAG TPA: hypothetical protein VKR27_06585 [Acidimicrobiales bacterium]|nr:hypothetical protein [Acidimicrobiales bacterium]
MRKRALGASSVVIAVVVPLAIYMVGTSGAVDNAHHKRTLQTNAHSDPPSSSTYSVNVVLSGASLSHAVGNIPQSLTQPDDLTALGQDLFVAFQNHVGPSGEPTTTTPVNSDSTVVEFTANGTPLGLWDLPGHVDGLTAQSSRDRVLATVNEDGNSSLFAIEPESHGGAVITQYLYNESPLPHGGGTDAISIYHGMILISASAPSPAPADVPAVYSVQLTPPSGGASYGTASVTPVFSDTATATSATTGAPVTLGLTDPDSNEVVPRAAAKFRGDFVLNSQGDEEQIYVHDAGAPTQSLSVLDLSQSVDDTAWATDEDGLLFVSDAANDSVDVVTGTFPEGTAFVSATPCDANNAPTACPTSPVNYLGTLDTSTGTVSPVTTTGVPIVPKGLLFVDDQNGDHH